MSRTLRDLNDCFRSSKAVFKAIKNSNNDIEFELVEPYDPNSVDLDTSDPVVKLMIRNYRETFDRYKRCYVVNDMVNMVDYEINKALKDMFINASPLKNPIQSKLFKWLARNLDSTIPQDGKLAIYRYLEPHVGNGCRFKDGSNNPHAKNFVAIVEKMRDKYE